jgi:hypothetical protein
LSGRAGNIAIHQVAYAATEGNGGTCHADSEANGPSCTKGGIARNETHGEGGHLPCEKDNTERRS